MALVVRVVPSYQGVEVVLDALVLVFGLQAEPRLLGGEQPALHLGGRPVAVAAGLPVLVDVVGVAEDGHARMVVEVESEGAGGPAVVCSGARLGVGNVAPGVLPFQVDVHHEVLGLDLAAQSLALLGALVIHLDVFHGEIRQVFQHHLVLSLEEVLAVEQQVVNLLAVDVYVAVVLELHPRHLADEPVEHRTLGEVERRGVVDDGVAAVCYLHARAADHHFVEPHVLVYVVAPALHEQPWYGVIALAPPRLQVEGVGQGLVALGLGADEVAHGALRHAEAEA